MIFIIFIELLICTLITYLWTYGSHFYINMSRSYAASSFPGDITFTQKILYQLFFSITLFGTLCIITFLLYLIFKNKLNLLSSKKKIIYTIPLI
ncbi:hypothetical protein, partial [Metasolibacillus meyeri]|uniref:hypothetical protein n=1 Tax=Metasolibacillus meyeri TaxID=1071052 RepID=UPI001EE7597A